MLLYITVMLKPLIPIVSDWYSHEFNEIEHLTKVHAVYGSHHLQKELFETGSENSKTKTPNSLGAEDQVSFHISPEQNKSTPAVREVTIQFATFKRNTFPSVLISRQGPPPKFS